MNIPTPTQDTPSPKPIIYVDASALKESSCQRKFLYTIFYGFTRKQRHTNYQAGYGSAFHKALEYWYSSQDLDTLSTQQRQSKALELATKCYEPYAPFISDRAKEFRTPAHLIQSIQRYFSYYNPDTETIKPINNVLESKFAIPWYNGADFSIVLSGTIDMIADYQGQEVFVDHKTTSSWEKDKYFDEYKLSIQMMFYSYIIERLTSRRFPCLINGIFLKKQTKGSVDFDGVSFERSSLINFSDNQMKEFVRWLESRLYALLNALLDYFEQQKKGNLQGPSEQTLPNFSACSSRWGMCPYFEVCSIDPSYQDRLLSGWLKEPYEPLKFGE